MIERLSCKFDNITPKRQISQNTESYNRAVDRLNLLSELMPYLPPEYAESVNNVRRFILEEDAKLNIKSWPNYFLYIEDFQLYANLNPDWIDKSIEELDNSLPDIIDGFIGFSKYLTKWVENKTKILNGSPEAEKKRKMLFNMATKKIENIKKPNLNSAIIN